MKHARMILTVFLVVGWAAADISIKQIDLTGRISESELALTMEFEAQVERLPARIMVLEGAVLPTRMDMPKGVEMVLEEGTYYLDFRKKGKQAVSIDFEVQVQSLEQLRWAAFGLPPATIRQITLQTEKEDYKVEVQDAPRTQKLDASRVQAYLPSTGAVRINWSPELEKLSGELVATCDSVFVGSAKVGALLLQGRFVYTMPQGRLKDLTMALPDGLNVTQVSGADLLAWNVREQDGARQLFVELSRPHEKQYVLTVLAEQALPDFPCSFNFPVIEPKGVIRANGVVLVGTDSTIKLLVDELGGLTQVEPDAVNWGGSVLPARGLYAYMFANMPFSMGLTADNIVTSLHAQDQLVLALSENDASLEAKLDLEVRDAPTRDVELEVSKDWTVTSVAGQNVSDYDVRDRDGSRWIKVYFKKAVDNRALIQIRLEKTIPDDTTGFRMPVFRVAGVKSERGFLVLRGETGTRLEGVDLDGLREVNTGSLPIKIADARQAFRFKRSDWKGRVSVRQELSSIHTESFQLVSLGESGVFGSSLITYNIANAPVRSFTLRIPSAYRNVEVIGRDIRNWTQNGEEWTIHLQQRVIGDYTLLVTYDHPAKYQGEEELTVGGIQTLDVENETGYIALAGAANLSLAEEVGFSPSILPIDVDEVPEEYALLVNDSIMHAYKYVAVPHEARVRIKRFFTQQLLTQVADHIMLNTTLSREGEAVTVAVYHVKNTDQQYLPIRLPDGAALWSVKVNDSKIQVLDQGDGQVLIPVERRRDPNAPLKIEVTYAEQHSTPGLLGKVDFQAPQLQTQSVFARWAFQLPDGLLLASATGNMEIPAELASRRIGWGGLVSGRNRDTIGIGVCASVILGLGLFLGGRRMGNGKPFSFWLAVMLLSSFIAAMVVGGLLLSASVSLADAWSRIPVEWGFSKAVSGSDGGLQLQLSIADTRFELARNLGLLLAGLVPVVWMLAARKRRWLVPFLALLAILYSFSPYLAWLTLVLPHLLLFNLCFVAGRRKGANQKKIDEARRKMVFDSAPPVPSREGSVQPRMLGIIAVIMGVAAGCASVGQSGTEKAATQAQAVEMQVTVPTFDTETKVNVAVHAELEIEADKEDVFQLLGPDFILVNYELSSQYLTVSADTNGTLLQADRDGTYHISVDYLVAATYSQGEWTAQVWLPEALRNSVAIQLPEAGWNVASADAIRVRQDGAGAEVLFDSRARLCTLTWKPEERKTNQEQSRFFCDVNTLADFRPGMVGLRHDVRFNIAQGELQNLQFDIPDGMSITEVHGKGIGTWRYDPEAGRLEVVLSAPATESYAMRIGAQIARDKLPYQTTVKGIAVRNAAMQRGVVALGASAAVQIDIDSVEDLSGINTGDAARLLGGVDETSIKRAFRYNQMPFAATVSAEQVLPELRLTEKTSMDVATEQIRLTSRLNVTVSKSGIFSLRIRIPEGFDVDSLSGEAVSHWDEVSAGSRALVVNFSRQITGTVSLNLVLSRSGRDLDTDFRMPRIQIENVLKHTGTVVVTVERGIRITPVVRDGVSEISPRELGIRQDGSLAYRLLRPDWKIELHSEVMEPKVKAEVLQRVALSEGVQKVRCYLQYDIEHAGVKTFRLQPPRPDIALVVSGRNISRVQKVDDETGIWEVELHGKVEHRYGMEVAYQLPFAHDRSELEIQPLLALGTESQKGYIAVLSSGRLQITPAVVSEFLRTEDARSIPRRFGADDLSSAVLCYRATEGDFYLKLNVVRHDAAEVLPAQVRSVRIDSVITKDDQSLNSMVMELEPGSLRFLEVRLPEGAEIWSVFVNETAVRPLIEDGVYLVPIEPGSDLSATVEMMYAQSSRKNLFSRTHAFEGPRFKLPLKDVAWTFYAPDGYRYSRFDGTMQLRRSAGYRSSRSGSFDTELYYSFNTDNSTRSGESAKQNIEIGNELMQSGDQRNARKAFQKAISYSQGQQALNEDARVQFRNLVRQQGVVGLVNRRNQLKQSLNQLDEETPGAPAGEPWSGADVQKIEAQLGEKESSALSTLAEKMLDQQQAASTEVHPIRVVMARQGTEIQFERTLQLQPDSEMQVEFRSAPIAGSHTAHVVAVSLAVGMVLLLGGLAAKMSRAA